MQRFVTFPEPQTRRIDSLFKGYRFTIPSYQREYSWGSDEAMDLLHDILQVAEHKENIHFFGSIVILPSEKESGNLDMIIDGQQRISTSAILLAIFRDLAVKLLKKIPQKERTFDNQTATNLIRIKNSANDMLFKNNHNNITRRQSLSLIVSKSKNESTKQNYGNYFNGLILRDGSAPKYYDPDYKPIKLLHRVHEKMRRTLHNLINKKNDIVSKADFLFNTFKAFISRFYVVLIKAPTREDAITVYMTLNNRGKDLSTSDIVKGQLAGVLEDNNIDISDMMSKWTKMAKQLNNDNKTISYFIREYWEASHNVVTDRQLARAVIHNVNTPSLAKQMINDLLELVPIYKILCDPASNNIFHSKHLLRIISTLNIMGLQQYYSIILAMYHSNYDEQAILKVMNLIERIEMRRLPFHSIHAHYSRISRKIWNGSLSNLADIIDRMSNELLFSDDRTYTVCTTYQHKGAKAGKGVNIIQFMISKLYSLNGDFNNGHSLYHRIFFDKDYHILHVATSGINNAHRDYLGNWTIIENNLFAKANESRNVQNIVNALRASNLVSNKQLANSIENCVNTNDSLDNLILKRQDKFAHDYIKAW